MLSIKIVYENKIEVKRDISTTDKKANISFSFSENFLLGIELIIHYSVGPYHLETIALNSAEARISSITSFNLDNKALSSFRNAIPYDSF